MQGNQAAKYYIFIVLAVLLIVAMVVMAFLQGRIDGAEHKLNRTNQTANALQ